METIEKKVADAILQREQVITLENKKFKVAPPTAATLIMLSECVCELPTFTNDNVLSDVLHNAKETKPLGKALAIMILGAKRIKENKHVRVGLFKRETELEWLTNHILNNLTITQLATLITERLAQMQIGDFFALTASLNAANITKPTREAETAFGEA